jgi:hypothetical protein
MSHPYKPLRHVPSPSSLGIRSATTHEMNAFAEALHKATTARNRLFFSKHP